MRWRRVVATLAFGFGSVAWADVRLLDEAGLLQALDRQPPCCVVDGRAPAHRKALPVADALPYRPGMKIHPTATVVVVADSDEQAMNIARRLDRAYPGKSIIAVKGGRAVWASVLSAGQPSHSVQGSRSFVIPSNTCEQGTPLETLNRGQP